MLTSGSFLLTMEFLLAIVLGSFLLTVAFFNTLQLELSCLQRESTSNKHLNVL